MALSYSLRYRSGAGHDGLRQVVEVLHAVDSSCDFPVLVGAGVMMRSGTAFGLIERVF